MAKVLVGNIRDRKSVQPIFDQFHHDHSKLRIGVGTFDSDDGHLTAEHDGVRFIWIDQGEGEIFLNVGYRTQEGDGDALPDFYELDELDSENLPIISAIAENVETLHDDIKSAIDLILDRFDGRRIIGDISSAIWLIEELEIDRKEWSSRPKVRRAFELLIENYSQMGWSTKQISSFEPIRSGDQLTVTADEPICVRGKFRYLWIEDTSIFMTHLTTARRASLIRNTPGGCNTDGYRRLIMPWICHTATEDKLDGVNSVNSHLVQIEDQFSRTHYHPSKPIGIGNPQFEIYQVLDPNNFPISPKNTKSQLFIFPDLDDLTIHREIDLSEGDLVYIPPDTGHRGMNAIVNVLAIPGFKPHNEIQLDRQIAEKAEGSAPFNENFA